MKIVDVNPHVWGSAVGQAASLQLLAAIPQAHHSLFACAPLRQKDGWVGIPRRPGLGIEVGREILRQYSVVAP